MLSPQRTRYQTEVIYRHLSETLSRSFSLPVDRTNQLIASSSLLEYKKGQHFPRETEPSGPIYFIASGVAAEFVTGYNRRAIVGLVGPPDLLCLSSLIGSSSGASFKYQPLVPCNILTVTAAALRAILIESQSNLARALTATFGRWEDLLTHQGRLAALSTSGRLASVLLRIAQRFAVVDDRGLLIPFKISHAMLGEMVGASRQHVTIQMVEFTRNQAILSLGTQMVIVPGKLSELLKDSQSTRKQKLESFALGQEPG